MPPDLNSLPTSRPTSSSSSPMQVQPHPRPRRISLTSVEPYPNNPPSPRSPSLSSLQAAATINANLQRSGSSSSPRLDLERRRSSLINNLNMNDPTIPAPGEMVQNGSGSPTLGRRRLSVSTADPHHQRAPSLGQLHQELENEQEAQVNRLLHMIRIQQDQIAAIQSQQNHTLPSASPTSTEPSQILTPASTHPSHSGTNITEHSSPRSFPPHQHFNRPPTLSRQSSIIHSNGGTSSHSGSPSLRPASASLGPVTEGFLLGGTRDESAFYQAETQMLTRENQMLKLRVRELGKCQKGHFRLVT